MADTYRQRIMDEVRRRLGGIRVSSGWLTDIGRRCYGWKSLPVQEIDTPCVWARDPSDEMTEMGPGRTGHSLRVEITAAVAGGGDEVDGQMRCAAADILRAVGADPPLLGLGAADGDGCAVLYIGPAAQESADVAHEKRRYGAVSVAIEVQYVTPNWRI